MKDKTRITVILCTSASGAKCPLAIIEKSKNPKCVSLATPPLLYKEKNNAWFNCSIFKWWIHNVFWPCHKKMQGILKAVFLVENCTAHQID